RSRYVPELREFLKRHETDLDPDSRARLDKNPMRTFDSKSKETQAVLDEAPLIGEYLSDDARAHLSAVEKGLEAVGVPYAVDERLVRGLDYYTMTVFEAKSGALGAQDTVGAGGRYNGLVEALGGPAMPGIGFGTGVERILLAANAPLEEDGLDVYFVTLAPEARLPAMGLAASLRTAGLRCDLDYADRSAKGQFKQADRTNARFAIVIGDEELARNVLKLRDMASGEEKELDLEEGAAAVLRAVGA
ncbi:MAG: histidine--tRNA ligase, partial [Actinomycetota bacterium]|nr:histidine--tRNA ligase [Actinomycetota bacterium]